MLHVARLIFYPHQLPPTLRARRLTPSTCGVYDLTIFWFLEAREPIMNDSSSRGPLNARICGALSLASFLGTGVASPSVRFPSYIYTMPIFSFLYFNLADFSRENPSPLLPIWFVSCYQHRHFRGRFIYSRSVLPVSSSSLFPCSFTLPEQFFIKDVSLGT